MASSLQRGAGRLQAIRGVFIFSRDGIAQLVYTILHLVADRGPDSWLGE
jgi:hypothetical protein